MHRLVIIDDENRAIGIISLSDILTYIVLKCDQHSRKSPPPYHSIDTSTKTASLTQAFGLTRLSTSHDHVVLNEAHGIHSNTENNSATYQQSLTSSIDGTIFEDDPMETEQPPLK